MEERKQGETAEHLLPYTAADAACVKCRLQRVNESGQKEIVEVHYCTGQCWWDGRQFVDMSSLGSTPIEHLHRTCPVCGFEWLETIAAEVA